MIVVVDYGVNNLSSVVRAVRASGHDAVLSADPDTVRRAVRLIVPGVGNFTCAAWLQASGLGDAIREVGAAGRPVLGICLGCQLLFAESDEAPGVSGLGLLPGRVQRFQAALPVPHVGWSQVTPTGAGRRHAAVGPLFSDGAAFYYHVHSYHPQDVPLESVYATGDYGGVFPTIVGRDNLLGAQFHPEKSQKAGLAMLDAFARWTP